LIGVLFSLEISDHLFAILVHLLSALSIVHVFIIQKAEKENKSKKLWDM
jgi:hypothetical protein